MTTSSSFSLRRLLLALAAVLPFAAQAADAPKPVRILSNWFAQPDQAGYWQAQQDKLGREAGIEISVLQGGPKIQTIPQVASGQAEFGIGNADDVLLARLRGAPVRAVFAHLDYVPYTLVYHADPAVKSIADLQGRTFAVNIGNAYWEWTKKQYKLAGTREIPVSGDLGLFRNDPKMVQQGYSLFLPARMAAAGVQVQQITLASLGYRPYDVLFTTDDMIRKDGGLLALDTVDFALRPGEFVSIVGPSGCGKSTLLRIMAGLVAPSTGRCTRPDGIETAFVFQEAALLPWRNVERNAQLLMELEGHPPQSYRPRAAEALKLVGLAGFEKSYPHQLSGGMRMRLSLARALALRPGLLLLDEPLAAVDELTRDVLQEELSSLWRQAGFTGVLVTHNVHEAVYLSNRVVVMSPRPGRILDVIDVPFAFPRAPELRASADFAALTGQVTAVLRAQHHAQAVA